MALAKKTIPALAVFCLAACGRAELEPEAQPAEVEIASTAPSVTFTPKGDTSSAGRPSGPIAVHYRLIGKPVVGQPISIDLRVTSTLGPQPVTLNYRINEPSAMQLAESQPDAVTLAASIEGRPSTQQVTIIPMREGRLYLNVSASVQTENGTMSTVTAIPIQVGEAPRTVQDNGTLSNDEDGKAIRILPADDK